MNTFLPPPKNAFSRRRSKSPEHVLPCSVQRQAGRCAGSKGREGWAGGRKREGRGKWGSRQGWYGKGGGGGRRGMVVGGRQAGESTEAAEEGSGTAACPSPSHPVGEKMAWKVTCAKTNPNHTNQPIIMSNTIQAWGPMHGCLACQFPCGRVG